MIRLTRSHEGTKNKSKKRILLAAISSFIALAVSVILIEVFLSFRYEKWKLDFAENGGWYGGLTAISENPDLMWEYRPNTESNLPELPTFRTNRYGFRDYDYETMDKEAGVYRIAFIGDSVTLGLGVGRQSTFVRKFENYAKEGQSRFKIQAMNFGIDGYNVNQTYELLASKALLFKPDKVIYVLCLNDFDFEKSSGDKIRYFNKPKSFVLEALEEPYRYIRRTDFHLWHYKKNKQSVFDKIIAMKQLLLARKVDFQIVVMPVFGFKVSDKDFLDDFMAYPLHEMHLEIGRFLTEQEIDFVDLLESFRNQEKPPKYFAFDVWHPSIEGHDFIAKQLLQPLLEGI